MHCTALLDLICVLGAECVQTPIYLVVETSGSNTEHDYAKLEAFLEEAYNHEIIADGTIAQDSTQQAGIWKLRESISEGLRHAGTSLYCCFGSMCLAQTKYLLLKP